MDSISVDGIRGEGPLGSLVLGLIISSALDLNITAFLAVSLLIYIGAKVLPSMFDYF